MTCRHVFWAALLPLGLDVAACGSHSAHPVVQPALSTVGTLSQGSLQQPIVRDTEAVRNAMTGGQADEAFSGVYDLVNRAAADPDAKHGAATIRRELPKLVHTFMDSYATTRTNVLHAKVTTKAGEQIRKFGLYVLDQDAAALRSFNADVARSRLAFGAASRFANTNDAMLRRDNARLSALIQALTPDERAAVEKAVREVFGKQVK